MKNAEKKNYILHKIAFAVFLHFPRSNPLITPENVQSFSFFHISVIKKNNFHSNMKNIIINLMENIQKMKHENL